MSCQFEGSLGLRINLTVALLADVGAGGVHPHLSNPHMAALQKVLFYQPRHLRGFEKAVPHRAF